MKHLTSEQNPAADDPRNPPGIVISFRWEKHPATGDLRIHLGRQGRAGTRIAIRPVVMTATAPKAGGSLPVKGQRAC